MTLHRSHDRSRLEGVRLRNASRPTPDAGKPRRTEARPHRTANRSLLLQARILAGEQVGGLVAVDNTAAPEGARELAREALRSYRAFVRELGTSSPTARAHALAFALLSAAAQRLTFEAAAAGLGTDRGLELMERATKCQARAERSATAAITFAGLLRSSSGASDKPAPWLEGDGDEGGDPK